MLIESLMNVKCCKYLEHRVLLSIEWLMHVELKILLNQERKWINRFLSGICMQYLLYEDQMHWNAGIFYCMKMFIAKWKRICFIKELINTKSS